MMTFPELIRPIDWLGFINPKEGRATGIQGAHLFAITVTVYLTPKFCHSLSRHSTHPAWLRA